MWHEYLFARSIGEALDHLSRYGADARVIAGGTGLVLERQRGRCTASIMFDITRIADLGGIGEEDGWVRLGAAVTHAQAVDSLLLRARGPLLAQACGRIAGPQARNVGTVVGNAVLGLPAGDAALALAVLDAWADVHTASGSQWIPVAELSSLQGRREGESRAALVTHLRFRALGAGYAWSQERVAPRRMHAWPILNVAVAAAVRGGCFEDVRIAMGPCEGGPRRLSDSEAVLRGRPPGAATIREAAEVAAAAYVACGSHTDSTGYLRSLATTLVSRALGRVSRQDAGGE